MIEQGGDSWFFITADYAFGHALERDTAAIVRANGGKVLGAVRHPQDTPDLSSYLLQAQNSKAKVIGLANAGGDTINSIKQANEFGIVRGGQKMIGLLTYISDVHGIGLQYAKGLILASAFYWDLTEETRAWTKRFMERSKKIPTMANAGVYGATLHYLKAIKETGTDEAQAVVHKMKEITVNDFFTKDGRVREDGRVIRDMYLFQVKSPEESKYPYDYYRLLKTVPGQQAFRPLADGGCPMIAKKS
jgi:branched-chain amino acid transport system substrate-binding protein